MGVKKPQEAQKAKALWKIKAAKDSGRRILRSQRVKTIFWGDTNGDREPPARSQQDSNDNESEQYFYRKLLSEVR